MIHKIVERTLATDIRDVQEQIAPAGLRSVLQANCYKHDWHPLLCVCTVCGVTLEEIHFRDRRANDAADN